MDVQELIKKYEKVELPSMGPTSFWARNFTIGTIGSHSALDIASGAKKEGFKTLVVCKKGREEVYEFHKKRFEGQHIGCIDNVMTLPEWKDIATDGVINSLVAQRTIFIPHRSMEVYCGYDIIEKQFPIPLFGNRMLLRAEERAGKYKIEKNQDYLAKVAGLPMPMKFSRPEEIDRPVIVKATAAVGERHFERRFPVVKSSDEYESACSQLVLKGQTPEQKKEIEGNFRSAPIEEFIDGPKINLNYFNSVLHNRVELLGCDTRYQFPNGEECAHVPVSLRESLLEKAYSMGKKFVEAVKQEYDGGVIGPFALQTIGDEHENLKVYDISLRIPGSPDTAVTPYTDYLFGEPISFGRRIGMEISEAIRNNSMAKILT